MTLKQTPSSAAGRDSVKSTCHVIVEADGASRGNPGQASYGAVVKEARTREVLTRHGEQIGVATNNVAEYRGLIAGLKLASEVGATHVTVQMDSRLVIEQMKGRWQVRDAQLAGLHLQAAAHCKGFASVTFAWVPRSSNTDADALANFALDGIISMWRPAAPVSVKQSPAAYDPTVHRPNPRRVRTETPRTVRVEQTAALAAAAGLWQPTPDEAMVSALRACAAAELTVVWDSLPAVRWLVTTLNANPLAWKRRTEVQPVEAG